MRQTIEIPDVPALDRNDQRCVLDRFVLSLQLTRAFQRKPLTARDRSRVNRAIAASRRASSAPRPAPHRRVSATDVAIAHLYDELAALDAAASSASTDAERARKLARLRELQRAEADRAERWFTSHDAFDPGAARTALRRAEELIARHARPS